MSTTTMMMSTTTHRATAPTAKRARTATRKPTRARRARPVSPVASAADGGGLEAALAEARAAPNGTTEKDFSNYYAVLNSATPEEAQRAVEEMVAKGELTEGVVEAALATMRAAEDKNERPEVLAALKSVFEFLLESYQRANAPPALGVVDAVVGALDAAESAEDEERVVKEKCAEGGMSVEEFGANVDGFLTAMEEQDAGFEAQVAELRANGASEEMEEQIAQLAFMRANAKAQMLCIREIVGRMTS